ncbi:MAG: NHLP family bacteriocin export ABC transporter peptidase/permease/ATPase subunit [Pseudomonadota bacterium]
MTGLQGFVRRTLSGLKSNHVRTPTVLQMEAVECGAAALAIVLGYFGRFVPLEKLRADCGVSRDGSNAGSMLKVARTYGLVARGFRRLPATVLNGPFPSIVLWNLTHFVVVEGTKDTRIFLNDPALGRRTVDQKEFEASFSSIALTFEKGASFEPGGKPTRLLPRISDIAKEYRWYLVLVVILGLLIAIPTFVAPGFMAVFVDEILVQKRTEWLTPLVLAITGATVLLAILAWLKEITLLRLETTMSLRRSADYFWHVLRLPASFFGLRYLGDIANRATSVERVAQVLTVELGSAAINSLTVLVVFLLMFFIDPALAVISLFGAILNLVVLRILHRARVDASIRLQSDESKLFSTSLIGIRSIETLKATGSEDDYFAKWSGYHARSLISEQSLNRLEQMSAIVPPFIVIMTTAIALTVGGARVIEGVLTLGALLAYQVLFATMSASTQQIVTGASQSQQVAADLARLDDAFNYPIDWRHCVGDTTQEHQSKSAVALRLRSVTFGYAPLAPPLIQDLDIEVKPGGWVAVVGASGSGKSTVGKLISGLYEPWSGEVLLDGRAITSWSRKNLSDTVATVDQDIAMFNGSIQDNICLWDSTVPFKDIRAAIEDAELSELVDTLPGNIDAAIEEGGRNLSGGQRQRIEIARGIVRNPALIVLDEATSALDAAAEFAVMNAIRRRGMTCIVIAHRLSTIRDCDEIIVLDHGRVAERGRHEDLIARDGAYAALIAEDNPE